MDQLRSITALTQQGLTRMGSSPAALHEAGDEVLHSLESLDRSQAPALAPTVKVLRALCQAAPEPLRAALLVTALSDLGHHAASMTLTGSAPVAALAMRVMQQVKLLPQLAPVAVRAVLAEAPDEWSKLVGELKKCPAELALRLLEHPAQTPSGLSAARMAAQLGKLSYSEPNVRDRVLHVACHTLAEEDASPRRFVDQLKLPLPDRVLVLEAALAVEPDSGWPQWVRRIRAGVTLTAECNKALIEFAMTAKQPYTAESLGKLTDDLCHKFGDEPGVTRQALDVYVQGVGDLDPLRGRVLREVGELSRKLGWSDAVRGRAYQAVGSTDRISGTLLGKIGLEVYKHVDLDKTSDPTPEASAVSLLEAAESGAATPQEADYDAMLRGVLLAPVARQYFRHPLIRPCLQALAEGPPADGAAAAAGCARLFKAVRQHEEALRTASGILLPYLDRFANSPSRRALLSILSEAAQREPNHVEQVRQVVQAGLESLATVTEDIDLASAHHLAEHTKSAGDQVPLAQALLRAVGQEADRRGQAGRQAAVQLTLNVDDLPGLGSEVQANQLLASLNHLSSVGDDPIPAVVSTVFSISKSKDCEVRDNQMVALAAKQLQPLCKSSAEKSALAQFLATVATMRMSGAQHMRGIAHHALNGLLEPAAGLSTFLVPASATASDCTEPKDGAFLAKEAMRQAQTLCVQVNQPQMRIFTESLLNMAHQPFYVDGHRYKTSVRLLESLAAAKQASAASLAEAGLAVIPTLEYAENLKMVVPALFSGMRQLATKPTVVELIDHVQQTLEKAPTEGWTETLRQGLTDISHLNDGMLKMVETPVHAPESVVRTASTLRIGPLAVPVRETSSAP